MKPTCRIQWIDAKGQPTPDTDPAIGTVQLPARVVQIAGRGVHMDASEVYPICADHARQIVAPWTFVPYTDESAR